MKCTSVWLMSDVSTICDTIGRDAIMRRLGVSKAAVSNAVTAGKFPASWYASISAMCAASNVDCPLGVFSFRDPQTQSEAS